jgi:hypothetical protein
MIYNLIVVVMRRDRKWDIACVQLTTRVFVCACQYAAGRKRGHPDDPYSSGYVSYPQMYSADYSNAAQAVSFLTSQMIVCSLSLDL